MTNQILLLKHLQFLTSSFRHKNDEIFYVRVYSRKKDGKYETIRAKNEGLGCVDDTARAVMLALEIYEFFRDKTALRQAERWIPFLEYMQDSGGYLTNFIDSTRGRRKYGTPSSFKGGPWWSARAKWTWAKAYKLTHDKSYLDLYFRTKIKGDYECDVAAILLLAGLEIFEKEDSEYMNTIVERISSTRSRQGYLIHSKDTPLHLWGYHELEALAKTSRLLNDTKLLNICGATINSLVSKVINDGFYYEFLTKDKREINPYCVSPLFRGLYEIYQLDRGGKYLDLMGRCLDWLGKLYDPRNGRCFDWISNEKITTDCGAEASIEAGFCWLRGLKLGLV